MAVETSVMTVQEIAKRLTSLCRQGKYEEAQHELYADHAESIEDKPGPGMEKVTKGLDNIIKKGQHFMQMVEAIHTNTVSEPIIAGNTFAVAGVMEGTFKGMGRQKMEEICVYWVKDGKIIKEQFFS